LDETICGDCLGDLVFVAAWGTLTEDPGRNDWDLWLSSTDLSREILEFNLTILRSTDCQKPLPENAWDFHYKTMDQLLETSMSMGIHSLPTLDAYKFVNEPHSSPDFGNNWFFKRAARSALPLITRVWLRLSRSEFG